MLESTGFGLFLGLFSRPQREVRDLLPELQDSCLTFKYLVFRGLRILRQVGQVCACGCMAPIKTWRREGLSSLCQAEEEV